MAKFPGTTEVTDLAGRRFPCSSGGADKAEVQAEKALEALTVASDNLDLVRDLLGVSSSAAPDASAVISVADAAARNAIPDGSREEGVTLVYQRDIQVLYWLGPAPWDHTDADWRILNDAYQVTPSAPPGVSYFKLIDQRDAEPENWVCQSAQQYGDLAGTRTFVWDCSTPASVAGTLTLTDLNTNTIISSTLPAGGELDVDLGTISHTATQTHTWRLSGVDVNSNAFHADFVVTWVAAPITRTLYVRTDGNDSNNGSADNAGGAFRTLQAAANAATAGTTVHVRAGTYVGFTVGLVVPARGVNGHPIRFLADSGVIVNTRNPADGSRSGINVEGTDWVVIDGFKVTNVNNNDSVNSSLRTALSTNITFSNNECTNAYRWGILAGFCDTGTVINNHVHDGMGLAGSGTGHGVYWGNSYRGGLIANNLIENCPADGIHTNGDLRGNAGSRGYCDKLTIRNNTVLNTNTVRNGASINPDGIVDSRIDDNLILSNSTGLTLYQSDAARPSTGNLIVNNTIFVTSTADRSCVSMSNGAVNNTLYNNLMYNAGVIASNNSNAYVAITPDSRPGTVFDYNGYVGPANLPGFGFIDGNLDFTAKLTFAQWQFSGYDTHGVRTTTTATFADYAQGNYRLAIGSLFIDAGHDYGTLDATDLDGNARVVGSGVDIGCYEFDPARPYVTAASPASGTLNVATLPIALTFSKDVVNSGYTLAVLSDGVPVSGSVGYDSGTFTLTFTPDSPYTPASTVTYTISDIESVDGHAIAAPFHGSFGVTPLPAIGPYSFYTTQVPSQEGTDGIPYELGMQFTPLANGAIVGMRFYQSLHAQGGSHTLNLYAIDGTLLKTVTLTGDTTLGWREGDFSSPATVSSGTQYVASYTTLPDGYFPSIPGYFGSTLANGPVRVDRPVFTAFGGFPADTSSDYAYFVDIILDTRVPISGATGVALSTTVVVHFNVAVDSSTISVVLSPSAPGSLAYDSGTKTATFTPTDPLDASTTYTVTVSGAQTPGHNYTMLSTDWTFDTTGSSPPPPPPPPGAEQTLFGSTVPSTVDSGDGAAYAMGVIVQSGVAGHIKKVRFYKATGNTGTHTAHVWFMDSDGTAFANATADTFTGETSSGWQEVTLEVPVYVLPGHPYKPTIDIPNGHYSVTAHAFDSDLVSGDITGLASGSGALGNNSYSIALGTYPTNPAANASSYGIDVAFVAYTSLGSEETVFGTGVPGNPDQGDTSAYTLGTVVKPLADGHIVGVRFYKSLSNVGPHVGYLWTIDQSTGAMVALQASVVFPYAEGAQGWQTAYFLTPFAVTAGTFYKVGVWMPHGHYAFQAGGLNSEVGSGNIVAVANSVMANSSFITSQGFPSSSGSGSNYYVDAVFTVN